MNREIKLALFNYTFVELEYELWIDLIGCREHTILKIGQTWPKLTSKTCSKVLSRFHITGEIALNDEYLGLIFPRSQSSLDDVNTTS